MAEDASTEAIKKALFKGKTVVWFNDLLIGRHVFLEKVLRTNLTLESKSYSEGKSILTISMTNHSAMPFHLKYTGGIVFMNTVHLFLFHHTKQLILKSKHGRC